MKTKQININRDQLAVFFADKIKSIRNYNFDMFYDIRNIVDYSEKNRGNHEKETHKTWYLFLRDFGSWMPEENNSDLIKECIKQDVKECYKITIYPSCDYFYGREFAEITRIDNFKDLAQ